MKNLIKYLFILLPLAGSSQGRAVKITNGVAVGKVATSTGSGNYTWQTPAGGGNISGTGVDSRLPFFTDATTLSTSSGFNLHSKGNTDSLGLVIGGVGGVNNPSGESYPYRLEIIEDSASVSSGLKMTKYGNGVNASAPDFHTYVANGSSSYPSAIQSGRLLFSWGFRGYGTSAWSQSAGAFQVAATQNWTNTANGMRFIFQTTPNNGSLAQRDTVLILDQDGSAQFGRGIQSRFTPNGSLVINGTAPIASEHIAVIGNVNGENSVLASTNTSTGSAAIQYIQMTNATSVGNMSLTGTGWTPGAYQPANGLIFGCNGTGGITHWMNNGSYKLFVGGLVTPKLTISNSTGLTTWAGAYHLFAAGTATAGTAPIKFQSGTNLGTAETGAMEYNGTNLFFTRTGTTRESVITVNSVNAVSPTAQNRTLTVVIDGTTYYISAKTTND